MTVEELARLVSTMRLCQAQYFRTRDAHLLIVAKEAERRVDAAVTKILTGQGDLF